MSGGQTSTVPPSWTRTDVEATLFFSKFLLIFGWCVHVCEIFCYITYNDVLDETTRLICTSNSLAIVAFLATSTGATGIRSACTFATRP